LKVVDSKVLCERFEHKICKPLNRHSEYHAISNTQIEYDIPFEKITLKKIIVVKSSESFDSGYAVILLNDYRYVSVGKFYDLKEYTENLLKKITAGGQ
jgi:hypothetical protein